MFPEFVRPLGADTCAWGGCGWVKTWVSVRRNGVERVSGAVCTQIHRHTDRYIDIQTGRQTGEQRELTEDVRVSATSAAETLRRNAARLMGWMGSAGGGGAVQGVGCMKLL